MAWLSGWIYRKEVTVTNSNADHQTKVLIGKSWQVIGEDVHCEGHVADDFDDLRFTASDGTTLLDYWIEKIEDSGGTKLATVWVQNNATPDTTLYMYYGGTEIAVSDGAATFIAFDDFEWGNDGDDIDTSGGDITWFKAGTTDGSFAKICTDEEYSPTRSLELYMAASPGGVPLAYFTKTAGTDYVIRVRVKNSANSYASVRHGNGSYSIYVRYINADLKYYDGSWHDTGVDIGSGWALLEIKNINWTAHTYDIYHNGVLAQSGATMFANGWPENYVLFQGSKVSTSCWFDDVILREYASSEPSFAFGSEEAAPITLELRSSTSPRSDLAFDTSVTIALKSTTSTRAAIVLDTLVAIHIRSPTATAARIVLDTLIALSLNSSSDTRADLILLTRPVAITQPATNIAIDGARLNGQISDDGGESCEAKFRYRQYLFQYWDRSDDNNSPMYGSNIWRAQTFIPEVNYKITSVKLLLYRLGLPGTINVSIETTDEDGLPTGSVLCSGTTDGDTLPTGSPYEWREITLGAGYDLTADTKYVIVVKALSGDFSNSAKWRYAYDSEGCTPEQSDVPAYTRGARCYTNDGGSTWIETLDSDLLFKTYGEVSWTETEWQNSLDTNDTYYADITSLQAGITYEFQTKARNGAGEGAWTASTYFYTIPLLLLPCSTATDARIVLNTVISLAPRSSTGTRAALELTISFVTTLELRSSTDMRAAVVLDTGIALTLKSSTDTRVAIALATGIAIALKSSTDTDARLALNTIIALALRSSTDTRADLTLSTLVALELKSSTTTRATLTISITAVTEISCRFSSDTRASLVLNTLISLALRSLTDTRASLELSTSITLALRSMTDTRASLVLSALVSLELRSSTSTRAAIALTIALATELKCRSATASRAAIQLNTLITLALLTQTVTRADLTIETMFRHQAITMAMQDRSLTMSMQERGLEMSMPSRTFGMKVRQNG